MAHHRLGNAQEALDYLVKAETWMAAADKQNGDSIGGLRASWSHWRERVIARTLYQEAKALIGLNPNFALAHYNLGFALRNQGKWDEAIAEFRQAIALKPEFAMALDQLGWALRLQGKPGEALAACQKAVELEPREANYHNSLGCVLMDQRKLDDATAELRKAIELDLKFVDAHANLGDVYIIKGQFAEAKKCLQKCLELLPEKDRPASHAYRQLQFCDRCLPLESRLADLLAGKEQPKDNRERIDLGALCKLQWRYAAATRFYSDAFAADAKLADDLKTWHRYNAACNAALAADGQGVDANKLDDKEKTRLRKQALDWLSADLALRIKQLDSGQTADRATVQQQMKHWQQDTDLAGLRDAASLAKLPVEERRACEKLWAEVADLLKKAEEKAK
jgi:tetratricopeptide (TPR) repeat protein